MEERSLKRFVCILTLCLILGPLALQGHTAQTVDRIVAIVNGQIITLFELNKRLRPVIQEMNNNGMRPEDQTKLQIMQKNLLQKLIDDILLLNEARQLKVDVSESDVETHIRQIRKSNNMSEEDLVQQLKLEQMTRKEYEDAVRDEMLRSRLLQGMVNRKIFVSDEEISDYYEKHKRQYVQDRSVDLAILLLPAGMDANQLAGRINGGELSFEQAVAQYSEGPAKTQGGSMGTLRWNQLDPEWRHALESLEPGQISRPLEINKKQALLKLVSAHAGDEKPLATVREEIRNVLIQPKYQQYYDEYLQRLRAKAIIDIRL